MHVWAADESDWNALKSDFLAEIFVRGAFGKFLAWSFISVTNLQTLSFLVSC